MPETLREQVARRFRPARLYVLWGAASRPTPPERFAREVAHRWEAAAEAFLETLQRLRDRAPSEAPRRPGPPGRSPRPRPATERPGVPGRPGAHPPVPITAEDPPRGAESATAEPPGKRPRRGGAAEIGSRPPARSPGDAPAPAAGPGKPRPRGPAASPGPGDGPRGPAVDSVGAGVREERAASDPPPPGALRSRASGPGWPGSGASGGRGLGRTAGGPEAEPLRREIPRRPEVRGAGGRDPEGAGGTDPRTVAGAAPAGLGGSSAGVPASREEPGSWPAASPPGPEDAAAGAAGPAGGALEALLREHRRLEQALHEWEETEF